MRRRRPRRPADGRQAGGRQEGSATLELTVLAPVVLLLLFGVVQGALWLHARNVALGAAQQGLRAARAAGVSAPGLRAREQARAFVEQAGGDQVLHDLDVEPASNPTEVTVVVRGRALSVLPGIPGPPVTQVAVGPRERFTP